MSYEGQKQDPSIANGRAIAMGFVVVMAFAVVALRLWSIQIQSGDVYWDKSRDNFIQSKRLEHHRGEIVDRNRKVLVSNRPSSNVYVTPAFLPRVNRTLRKLGKIIGLGSETTSNLASILSESARNGGPPLLLAQDLTKSQVQELRAMQHKLDIRLQAIPIVKVDQQYAAYIDPKYYPTTELVLAKLRDLLNMTDEKYKYIRRQVLSKRGLALYREILIRRELSLTEEGPILLEVELGDLPGVTVEQATTRSYHYGALAGHLIGYVNEISRNELAERRGQGYRGGDVIGRRGVERTFEEELRGRDGKKTVVVDSKGRIQNSSFARRLQSSFGEPKSQVPGHRVVLTIDMELQRAAEAAFEGYGIAGSVVLMEADTGRLLALTSTPTFNPAKLAGYFDPDEKKRLRKLGQEGLRPWRFRAIQDYFAPGSTFKVVTALAALEAKVIRKEDKIRCPGAFVLGRTRFRCWKDKKGHGPVNLYKSLAWSCDVYYYTLGAKMGIEPIANMAHALGYGDRTGIDLRAESKGIIPSKAWYRKRGQIYTLGAAVNASVGQGAVSVTPLQLAVSYAAIANGGKVYKPQIALRIEKYTNELVAEFEPKVLRTIKFTGNNLNIVREGLRQVVNVPGGTAYRKRLPDIQVSGKTGTAQVRKLGAKRLKKHEIPFKYRDHAWFAAYAPAENPKVVVAVFNEHGGGGSSSAAPIAMRVIDAWNKQRIAKLGLKEDDDLQIASFSSDSRDKHNHSVDEFLKNVPKICTDCSYDSLSEVNL